MIFDPRSIRLGKKPARHDSRTLRIDKYLVAPPAPPRTIDWSRAVSFPCGTMLNDLLGDCTCAGPGHAEQVWTGNANPPEVTISDSDIELLYEGSCGYNPSDPSTDQGGDLLTVLNWWRKNGIGTAGHKILAYVSVNLLNHEEVLQALQLCGCLYTGVMLPVSAQAQVGGTWDVDSSTAGAPGSWGGHCVVIPKAVLLGDPPLSTDGLSCITWGALQNLTWAFWDRYFDEAFAPISTDWISANKLSPSGFDLATLQADLASITS